MAPQKEIPANGITMENTRHIPAVLSTTKKDMIKTIMHIMKIVHRTEIAFFIMFPHFLYSNISDSAIIAIPCSTA